MANNPHHHHHHHHYKPLTSGVHADIDFMDIDQVMVVPDTPDRVSKQPKNICKFSSSGDSSLRNSVGEIRAIRDRRNQLFGDNIHSAGLYSHPGDNLGNSARKQGASSSDVPCSSSRHVPVSNMVDGKTFKHKERHHYDDQVVKDDRVSHSSFDRMSHHCHHRHHRHHHHHHNKSKNPILVEHGDIVKFSPKLKKEDLVARKMGKVHPHPSNIVSLNITGASSKSTKNDNDGKMKVKVDHADRVHCNAMDMKGSDSICLISSDHDFVSSYSRNDNKGKAKVKIGLDTEKGPTNSFRVPSNANRKRLVRNGCISPLNIIKAKKIEDMSGTGIKNAEGVQVSGGSHSIIDVNEVTSKQNAAYRAKGKGLLINDNLSMGHASGRNIAGNSTSERLKGKSPEDCIIVTDTRDNSNKNGIGKNTSFSSTSSANKSIRSEVQFCTPSPSFKRPKKISGSSEKSTDVIFLSSGGESSTMKPLRDHGGFSERESGSLSAHDEFCREERESISQIDNDSEARQIQLQADEILARELQEQLYNETPIFDSVERVSSLGREEQQENPLEATLSMGLNNVHDPVVASSSSRVRAPQQSLRARLFRRGSQSRLPRSNLSRIRSQLYRYPRGRRNLLSDMDVEMRMHFLESLEAVYNEDISMVNQLLNSDREFGENDYEMLLTLDENNHRHLGASSAQIANLPVSTVNNDNCEICSICLEAPVIGDTMRHLPCLHKFHRDCIDLWLRRKRSCPVCKSDV